MARDHTDYINPNLGWGNFYLAKAENRTKKC